MLKLNMADYWGWTEYADNKEAMQTCIERFIERPDYHAFCSIDYCTHCRKTIKASQPRRMCNDCTAMTLQERIDKFPHIKALADHIGMIFSSM